MPETHECRKKGCTNRSIITRTLNTGYAIRVCGEHDPLTDGRVSDMFRSVVGDLNV